jgi:hypothetical protein
MGLPLDARAGLELPGRGAQEGAEFSASREPPQVACGSEDASGRNEAYPIDGNQEFQITLELGILSAEVRNALLQRLDLLTQKRKQLLLTLPDERRDHDMTSESILVGDAGGFELAPGAGEFPESLLGGREGHPGSRLAFLPEHGEHPCVDTIGLVPEAEGASVGLDPVGIGDGDAHPWVSVQDPGCQLLTVATCGFHDDRCPLELVRLEAGEPGSDTLRRTGEGVGEHPLEWLVAPPGHVEGGLGDVDPLETERGGLGVRKMCHRASCGA